EEQVLYNLIDEQMLLDLRFEFRRKRLVLLQGIAFKHQLLRPIGRWPVRFIKNWQHSFHVTDAIGQASRDGGVFTTKSTKITKIIINHIIFVLFVIFVV